MLRIAEAVRRNERMLISAPRKPVMSVSRGIAASDQGLLAQRIYLEMIRYLESVGTLIELGGKRFDASKGKKILETIFRSPEGVKAELKKIPLLSSSPDRLSTHAANVTINVIQMGTVFKYEPQEHFDLAMAAFFHEVGMYTIPRLIREKNGKLSEREFSEMQNHCEAGRNLLQRCGQEYEHIAEVVWQEHERFDGSGYPRQLCGDEIHEHASIIGIVDMYTSMVQERPYRQRLLPAEAMREIITNCKGWFSTKIMRKLLYQLSVYPVQSYIRLNNQSVGVVVKTDVMWPLKPTVKLICDVKGEKLEEEIIVNLAENPLLHVQEVISEADTLNL